MPTLIRKLDCKRMRQKKQHHALPREERTCTIEFGMDEDLDSILDKSLMRLSTMVEEPDYTILLAFRKYTIYWEHMTIKKFFDGSIEMKRSGIYRRKGLIMRSCTVIDCKRIIFGQKMEAAGLRSYCFKTLLTKCLKILDI